MKLRFIDAEDIEPARAELAHLLTSSPAILYKMEFKDDGIFCVMVSSNIRHLLGCLEAESCGDNWWMDRLHPDDRDRVLEGMDRGRAEGSLIMEYRLRHTDGTYRWVEDNNRMIEDASGQVVEAVGVWTDITRRVEAVEALRQSEERFRGTFENAAVGIAHVFDGGKFHMVNDKLCEIVGYTRDEMLSMTFADLTFPEDMETSLKAYQNLIGGSITHYAVEKRYRRKEGSPIWISLVATVDRTPAGKAWRIISIFQDITQRKSAEKALAASQASMAAAQRIAHFGSWELDLTSPDQGDDQPLEWSDELYRIAGYEPGSVEVTRGFLYSHVPEADQAVMSERLASAIQHQQEYSVVHRLIRRDGREVIVRMTGQLVFDEETRRVLKMVGTAQDITSKKRAENEILLREQRYRSLVEATTAIVWDMPASGQFESVQPSWAAFTGQTSEQYLKWGWLDAIHPEDQETTSEAWTDAVEKRCTYAVEQRVLSKDGTYHHMAVRAVPILDKEGNISEWVGIHTDISERKQSEETLRLLGSAVHQSKESIMITDAQIEAPGPTILFVNPAFTLMTGYTAEEAIGKTPRILQGPRTDRAMLDRLKQNLQNGEPFAGQGINYRKDGTEFNIEWQIAPIRNSRDEVTHFVAIQRDITDRLNNERLSLRSQRLESLGTLAGGVAHDLNNSLAPILMGVGLLRSKHPEEADIMDILETSATRGANMVRQLLSFARGAEGERASVHIDRLTTELESMMKGTFPKNIELKVQCQPDLPTVLGDATQLHQVLMNLCVNARDAMEKGGTLTLEARTIEVDAAYASQIPDGKPGSHIMLRVRDTGTGIPREVIDRIFDPFFTTKGPEKGTGLGLSTVSGIVRGHGGFLHVYSQTGQGSTFSIYLPTEATNQPISASPGAAEQFRGSGETILVVDDDGPIRQMSCAVLESLNFNPMTAEDGLNGLALIAQHGRKLRAIITDMHMPNMDGLLFVQTLRHILPDVPVIIASGRLEDAVAERFKALGVTHRLDKPFTEIQLVECLSTLLPGG